LLSFQRSCFEIFQQMSWIFWSRFFFAFRSKFEESWCTETSIKKKLMIWSPHFFQFFDDMYVFKDFCLCKGNGREGSYYWDIPKDHTNLLVKTIDRYHKPFWIYIFLHAAMPCLLLRH
jgi:hypothetical protein